jgi:hypothetical protein
MTPRDRLLRAALVLISCGIVIAVIFAVVWGRG